MSTTLAQRLGYGPDDRVVIFHADDLGMSHGSNQAFLEVAEAGMMTCGSIMAPCPWTTEMIQLCTERPDLDVGIHLTLTSEWPQYRWGPLLRRDPADGLTDPTHCFWPTVEEVEAHADPAAAEAELRAQIDLVVEAGIRITHLDTHMGASVTTSMAETYLRLGIDYDVPIVFAAGADIYMGVLPPDRREEHHRWLAAEMVAAGLPPGDFAQATPLYDGTTAHAPSEGVYDAAIRDLKPGVTFFALHPNKPGDIDMIDPHSAEWRSFEYRYFRSAHLANLLAQEGIHAIGMRAIYDLVRHERAATSSTAMSSTEDAS